MTRETCRMPGCDDEPGSADTSATYRTRMFCKPLHELKYEHLQDDARDAAREEAL